jgi:hypothetical protein
VRILSNSIPSALTLILSVGNFGAHSSTIGSPLQADRSTRVTGSAAEPTNTSQPLPCISVSQIVEQAAPGSTIVLQGGSYPERLTIQKNLTITAQRGPALIGGYFVGTQEMCIPLLDQSCIPAQLLDPSAINCAGDPPGVRARLYYPAAAPGDGPVACGGPFPLVVYAHGNRFDSQLCDWSRPGPPRNDYLQAGGILTRLAATGFIVISVDMSWFPQNDQAKAAIILNAIAFARDESTRAGSRFQAAVDVNRVGLAGHSRGGAAVVLAAQLLQTSPSLCSRDLQLDGVRLAALALLAPGTGSFGDPNSVTAPVLVIHGTKESTQQVGDLPLKLYGSANPPKHLVVITGANHYGYTDGICIAYPGDNPSEVGGVTGPEAQRRQQRAAGDYLEAFFSAYLMGDRSRLIYLFQQGEEQCGYPANPPTCGFPARRFSDLDNLNVAVSVCSCFP